MVTIQLNKKHYSIPNTWNVLSAKQLLQVMDVLFLKGYKAEAMLLKLLKVVTGASMYEFLKWDVVEAEEYFYLLVFLLHPEFDFTKNILPVVRYKNEAYYGPSDHLDNLRMKEFVNTENLFMRWCETEKKDDSFLNELVAVLYRPSMGGWYDKEINTEGDCREPFNYNISLYQAKHCTNRWPMNVRLAIATWYDGCRRKLVSSNPDVFEGGSGEASRYGMISVMLNIAEGGVFGPFEKVEDQYVHLVMMQLNELVDKSKKMEAAAKA